MGFKIGDNIVYAGSGVCQIDDIKDISFFKEKPKEAIALIDKLPIDNCQWIEDRNERKATFTDIIVNGSREDIVGLIYLINRHAEKLTKEGKHLNAQDERALIDARNRMNNEIAVALNMEPDGVAYMIHEKTGLEDFA